MSNYLKILGSPKNPKDPKGQDYIKFYKKPLCAGKIWSAEIKMRLVQPLIPIEGPQRSSRELATEKVKVP